MNAIHSALSVLLLSSLCVPLRGQSASSQFSNVPQQRHATPLFFDLSKSGLKSSIRWGLDVSWDYEQNVRRGVAFIGQDHLTLGRTSFQPNDVVSSGGKLSDRQLEALRSRMTHLRLMGNKFDVILNCDQEALDVDKYSPNYRANTERWAALIDATTRQLQTWGYNVIGVAPLNEPDYGTGQSWGWKEGNEADFKNIIQLLKTNYSSTFEHVGFVGGNTLNCDNALHWYNYLSSDLSYGTTHQLAGSFDSYASFFSRVANDGKAGFGDELHNVNDAIVGQQYGMTMGIWWSFDGIARGQFCRATSSENPGERLGYAEDRDSWTSAAVYRNHVDGVVEGFVGSSERQANSHSYEFVSLDRDVYYDGRGPLRQVVVNMPGGTGYQTGQTNAERLVGIQYGEDVPRREITTGDYILMNRQSRRVLQPTGLYLGSGNSVNIGSRISGNTAQQWTITPVSERVGGDFSYYIIKQGNLLLDNENWSLVAGTGTIIYQGDGGNVEQWYLKYAGDGYYNIVNRHSGLCLAAAGSSDGSAVVQRTISNLPALQWRIMPVDNACEVSAPQPPSMLKAEGASHSIRLTWTPSTSADAIGYNVLRSPADTTDWNTIARGVADTTFIDNSVVEGARYLYKVRTLDRGDNLSRKATDEAEASTLAGDALVARWTMDGSLADTTDNNLDASLFGTANYGEGHVDGSRALQLDGASNFVQLPYTLGGLNALTFSAWVKLGSAKSWQRIFDFGNGTSRYLFLTPRTAGQSMRLALKNGGDEEYVDANGLPTGRWVHVAVTLGDGKATLWTDGEKVGQGQVSIKPGDIGPVLNYLGRSQYDADPLLMASLQDVRIYNHVLDDADIVRLAGNMPTGITTEKHAAENRMEACYGVDGQAVSMNSDGLVIAKFSDGSVKKMVRK